MPAVGRSSGNVLSYVFSMRRDDEMVVQKRRAEFLEVQMRVPALGIARWRYVLFFADPCSGTPMRESRRDGDLWGFNQVRVLARLEGPPHCELDIVDIQGQMHLTSKLVDNDIVALKCVWNRAFIFCDTSGCCCEVLSRIKDHWWPMLLQVTQEHDRVNWFCVQVDTGLLILTSLISKIYSYYRPSVYW